MKNRKNLPSLFSDSEKNFMSMWDDFLDLEPKFPSVDISENEKEVVVKANVPGINAEDINIDVNTDTLKLSGKTEEEKEDKKKKFYRYERQYGEFSRFFSLPARVDPSNVKAKIKNGVLTINLKKTKQDKKKVQIETE